tara:strand:+ start:432 stop:980 length:549 start_codon:yes stop_codon:yes gene_type:complete
MKQILALLSLIVIIGVGFTLPVNAQTNVSPEVANKYFENCKMQSDPRFSDLSQEMFCACTAAEMTRGYTIEDMQNAPRQDEVGRAATNKLIVNVYAPCIQYPAREYHYNTCVQNPKTKLLGSNVDKICGCTAEKVATHLNQNAGAMFKQILTVNPTIADPMQALYDDASFQKTVQSQLMSCL